MNYCLRIITDHELLIPLTSLKLVYGYLSKRKQLTKGNRTYGSWFKIGFSVPQGCMLGTFLFNIFLVHLFFILNDVDITSYADIINHVIADDVNGVIAS